MRRHAAFFILALLIASRGLAQDFSAVDQALEREIAAGSAPGAAIVVVKDDRVVHARAFGVTSVETQTPVTTDTLFRLGSTSKPFAALAVLALERAGKLRLDQPLGALVPDLPQALRALTLDALLTHTAGLRDDAPMIGPADESALAARIAAWNANAFFTTPGEIMSYSNAGYALIGHVIARVTGKPFSEAMQELVLAPAGMQRSTYRPLVAMTYPLALGHDARGVARPFAENAANYAPGSLFTSANDLGRFLVALLNRDAESLAKMATARVAIPAQRRHYGYGLIVQDYRDTKLALHAGSRTGYGSIIMILPKERAAVAILTNRSAVTASGVAFDVIDLFAKGAMRPDPPRVPSPITAAEARGLAGVYVNNDMIRVVLDDSTGALVAKFAGKTLHLTKTDVDRYDVEPGTQLESFFIVRDQSGAPRYLTSATWALKKEN